MEGVTETPDPDEVDRLIRMSTSEPRIVADLDGLVRELHQVQEAKEALSRLDAPTLRMALRRRGQGPATVVGS